MSSLSLSLPIRKEQRGMLPLEIAALFLSFIICYLTGSWLLNIVIGIYILRCFINPVIFIPLFMVAGFLKGTDLVQRLPVDFTLFTGSGILLLIILNLKHVSIKKERREFFMLMFNLGILLSILLTPATGEYLFNTAYRYLFLNIPIYYLFSLNKNSERIAKMVKTTFKHLLFLLTMILGLSLYNLRNGLEFTDADGNLIRNITAFGENYMIIGVQIQVLLLILVSLVLSAERMRLWYILFAVVGFYAMLLAPSRGVFFSAALATIIAVFYRYRKLNISYKIFFTLLAGLVLLLLPLYSNILSSFIVNEENLSNQRLFKIIDDSTLARFHYLKQAITMFSDNLLLGGGIGSITYINQSTGKYTHNLLLEIFAETGLITGIFFLMLLIILIGQSIKILKYGLDNKLWYYVCPALLFISGLTFSFSSGSLGEARNLWVYMGMVSGMYFIMNKNINSKTPEN